MRKILKKLLIISMVLVVAGLGLILVSDPVLSQPNGPSGPSQHLQNVTSGGGPQSGGGLPSGCTTQSNGGIACGSNSIKNNSPLGLSDVVTTGIGIALCGVGLFITAIESISKQVAPFEPKVVT